MPKPVIQHSDSRCRQSAHTFYEKACVISRQNILNYFYGLVKKFLAFSVTPDRTLL